MKSGIVACYGFSNVGKSTLINRLIGKKVVITSPRVQTTRDAIHVIYNEPDYQIVFIDLPGRFNVNHALSSKMQKTVSGNLDDVELILHVVDAESKQVDEEGVRHLGKYHCPVFLVINKVDLVAKEELLPLMETYSKLYQYQQIIPLSALKGDNCALLLEEIKKVLPTAPQYYHQDDQTNRDLPFHIKELIRESALYRLNFEIPHSIAITVDQIDQAEKVIEATIICERDSQKRIIIGSQGQMIKEIRKISTRKINQLLNDKYRLELFVKVVPDWRNKERLLKEYGYH